MIEYLKAPARTPGATSIGSSKSGRRFLPHEYIECKLIDKLLSSMKHGMRHEKALELVLSSIEAIHSSFGC